MLPSFCNQKIIRLRALPKDERGSEVPNWHDAWEEEIFPCSVQPAESYSNLDGRVIGLKNTYKVYVQPGTDIKAGDRIKFEGEIFLIDESPRKWYSPTGIVSNVQFTMTKWEG